MTSGLRHVELVGSLAEGAGLGDAHEILEMAQFHVGGYACWVSEA